MAGTGPTEENASPLATSQKRETGDTGRALCSEQQRAILFREGSAATVLRTKRVCGDDRTRTDDPLVANQVLSQLSYVPLGWRKCRTRNETYDTRHMPDRIDPGVTDPPLLRRRV